MSQIAKRYQRLLARRAPADDRVILKFNERFEAEYGEHTRYLLGAMRPLDKKYTQRLEEQGDRVADQLARRLAAEYPNLELERQGSVSNHTHIRHYSDVDVLAIIDKFYALEPPQSPASLYAGVPEDDLMALRRKCESALAAAFPAVSLDSSGAKSIRLTGGSLACPVDVVPANWYNTLAYAASSQRHDRAVQVLDKNARIRVRNQPFLVNQRIATNDIERGGMPRSYIRLLKTVKADVEEDDGLELAFSSFDACALVYRMPIDFYFSLEPIRPLEAVRRLLMWVGKVLEDASLREGLRVIDDTRAIFDSNAKRDSLHRVFNSLCSIYAAAASERVGRGDIISEGG